MSLTIVSRGGWNARAPRSAVATTARETFHHHTASDHRGAAGVRAIQNFHMDTRGWADIAYNFLIDRLTLVVYEGRGWGVRPGSQRDYNTGTWSVCVMGLNPQATPGLLDTIAQLIRHGHQHGRIPLTLTGGHRDAPGQATLCPGSNLYGAIPEIRRLLTSTDMSQPLQSWSRAAYEWAMSTDPPIYARGDLNAVRETIEAQREMTFRHRHFRAIQRAVGGGGGDHTHDGRYVRDVNVIR